MILAAIVHGHHGLPQLEDLLTLLHGQAVDLILCQHHHLVQQRLLVA